jgi:hypothetical protein
MWHLPLENSMVRLASLFAVACLALAATKLLSTPQLTAEQPQPDKGPDPVDRFKLRCLAAMPKGYSPFHARFSLN